MTRLADPDDGRAALIGITGHGQALLDDRKRIRRERLTALLATLTSEEECALWLSARVAFPVLRRLVANADCSPDSGCGESGRGTDGRDTTGRSAEGDRVRSIPVGRGLKKVWIPLVLIVVLAVSGLVVSRLHKMFASAGPQRQRRRGHRDRPVQPEDHGLRRLRPARDHRPDQLLRPGCERALDHRAAAVVDHACRRRCRRSAPASWRRTDGDQIGCRVTVNGTVREEQSANGVNAQTYCLVKSA